MLHRAYRSIVRRVPAVVKAPLKRAALSITGAARGTPAAVAPQSDQADPPTVEISGRDPSNPTAFASPETLAAIRARLDYDPATLLEMGFARRAIAADRAKALIKDHLKRFGGSGEAIAHGTLDYNLTAFDEGNDPVMERPMLLVNALCSIDRLLHNRARLSVLAIGPRSESEIFGLFAAGFSRETTRGLDLFSYSPFIDVGDMHALPYPDNNFDVVIHSFALSYSKDQQLAAREVIRVGKDRAIVAIGDDYRDRAAVSETRKRIFRDEATYTDSCGHILRLFEGHVGRTFINHEPDPPESTAVISVFELAKTDRPFR
jgi:hypothetical protein